MSPRYDIIVCLIYQISHILFPGRHLGELKPGCLKLQQVIEGDDMQIGPLVV